MAHEILTPAEMAEADRRTIASGVINGYGLMRRAGAAVADLILARYADREIVDVLCGPGNNGGDGYVVARLLFERGLAVRVFAEAPPKAGTDAERARMDCPAVILPLVEFRHRNNSLIVDALFGAGFRGELRGVARAASTHLTAERAACLAVDLPSGVDGETGACCDGSFSADVTVTFARMKPGHLLFPGRQSCGEVIVADIGIQDSAIRPDVSDVPRLVANRPDLWRSLVRQPANEAHKYRRGHCAVFSGGALSTGAARLAAHAAARAGAGAVTVLSPESGLAANAAHLTSIMLAKVDALDDLKSFLARRAVASAVIGPGFGVGEGLREFVLHLLEPANPAADGDGLLGGGIVIDADAITAFAENPAPLFDAAKRVGQHGPRIVLTPHQGEFGRLFPDIAGRHEISKVEKARLAAERSGAVLVYKGPGTVVATPNGRAAICDNAPSWLATAGSGDVLAGLIGGLLAQRLPLFEAACAAAWIHGEAANRYGPGLIAEDLPELIPAILRDLLSLGV